MLTSTSSRSSCMQGATEQSLKELDGRARAAEQHMQVAIWPGLKESFLLCKPEIHAHVLQEAAAAAEAQQAAAHAAAEDSRRVAQLQSTAQELQQEVQDLRSSRSSNNTSHPHAAQTGSGPSGRVPDRQGLSEGAESAGTTRNGRDGRQLASNAMGAEPQDSHATDRGKEGGSSATDSKAVAQLEARMDDAEKGLALCKRKLMAGQEGSEGMAAELAGLQTQLAAEQVCWGRRRVDWHAMAPLAAPQPLHACFLIHCAGVSPLRRTHAAMAADGVLLDGAAGACEGGGRAAGQPEARHGRQGQLRRHAGGARQHAGSACRRTTRSTARA